MIRTIQRTNQLVNWGTRLARSTRVREAIAFWGVHFDTLFLDRFRVFLLAYFLTGIRLYISICTTPIIVFIQSAVYLSDKYAYSLKNRRPIQNEAENVIAAERVIIKNVYT